MGIHKAMLLFFDNTWALFVRCTFINHLLQSFSISDGKRESGTTSVLQIDFIRTTIIFY